MPIRRQDCFWDRLLGPNDSLYAAAAYYRANCEIYALAAAGYAKAAECAMINALEGSLQAAKDEFNAGLLEDRAARADPTDATAANTRASNAKAKAAADSANARALEEKAKLAGTRAEMFCTRAKRAEANALETVQHCTQSDV